MRFSVVTASRLADYPGAAKERDKKLIRAVASVMQQSFTNWEMLVVADGCVETTRLVKEYIEDDRVRTIYVDHVRLWAGIPRNKGIDEATGDFIIYLDIDDVYGIDHLKTVDSQLNGHDWIWYNDYRYKSREDYWFENQCDVRTLGMIGTSNICHKQELDVRWDVNGKYAHDYHFVQKLFAYKNFVKTATPEYYCCHVPGGQTSGGYDL